MAKDKEKTLIEGYTLNTLKSGLDKGVHRIFILSVTQDPRLQKSNRKKTSLYGRFKVRETQKP
jgi:hypothetical protein